MRGSNAFVVEVMYRLNVQWSLCWLSELCVDILDLLVAQVAFIVFSSSLPEQCVLPVTGYSSPVWSLKFASFELAMLDYRHRRRRRC
jgi:hypothetical protein